MGTVVGRVEGGGTQVGEVRSGDAGGDFWPEVGIISGGPRGCRYRITAARGRELARGR